MSGAWGYVFFGGGFAVMAAIQARAYRRGGGWGPLAAAWLTGLLAAVQAGAMVRHLMG